jgi:hypothetical protein
MPQGMPGLHPVVKKKPKTAFICPRSVNFKSGMAPRPRRNLMQQEPAIEQDVFEVRESAIVSFVIAAIFYALFFTGLAFGMETFSFPMIAIALTPAILFTINGLMRKVVIRVDCNGIYYHKKLITDWAHFLEASVTQAEVVGSYRDDFVLLLRYQKPGFAGSFRMTIPLTSTQNQSEEAVLDALRRFYALSQEKTLRLKQPLWIEGQVAEG